MVSQLLPNLRPVAGDNGFGAGHHMIYADAAYVVAFAQMYIAMVNCILYVILWHN
jgi:hypothetical protein